MTPYKMPKKAAIIRTKKQESQPEIVCPKCFKPRDRELKQCPTCGYTNETQPEPMPLIDDLDNEFSETICSACLQGMQRDTCPYPQPCDGLHDALVNIKLLFQAWHNAKVQQVRKAIYKELHSLVLNGEVGKLVDFILAMAEKEVDHE